MIVTISTSGGIGGFGLGQEARVDLDTLSPELRAEACDRLDPAALEALSGAVPEGADRVLYHITIEQSGGATASFDLPESALPPETLDVIDDLLAEGRRP